MKPITLYKVMRRLERGQNLNIKSNNKFSLITVVNWELYQGKQDEEEHQKEHVGNTKGTPKEHKQEGKKGKRVLSSKDDLSPEGSGNGKQDLCPHLAIIKLYRKHLPMCSDIDGDSWTANRAKNLRTRWREKKERQELGWWDSFFEEIAKSKFLTGRVTGKDGRPFFANLDWIIKPEPFAKILEGRYHE
jgi:hypothetical protein